MKKVNLILIIIASLLSSCGGEEQLDNSNSTIPVILSGEISQINGVTLVFDENDPSNRYSRIDSVIQYGYGLELMMPDSLKDCDLKVIIEGKMRVTNNTKSYIAVSLSGNDNMLFWGQIFTENHVKEINKWTAFKDSSIIEKVLNNAAGQSLKIFPHKPTGAGFFDVDDLSVKIIKQ